MIPKEHLDFMASRAERELSRQRLIDAQRDSRVRVLTDGEQALAVCYVAGVQHSVTLHVPTDTILATQNYRPGTPTAERLIEALVKHKRKSCK